MKGGGGGGPGRLSGSCRASSSRRLSTRRSSSALRAAWDARSSSMSAPARGVSGEGGRERGECKTAGKCDGREGGIGAGGRG